MATVLDCTGGVRQILLELFAQVVSTAVAMFLSNIATVGSKSRSSPDPSQLPTRISTCSCGDLESLSSLGWANWDRAFRNSTMTVYSGLVGGILLALTRTVRRMPPLAMLSHSACCADPLDSGAESAGRMSIPRVMASL